MDPIVSNQRLRLFFTSRSNLTATQRSLKSVDILINGTQVSVSNQTVLMPNISNSSYGQIA